MDFVERAEELVDLALRAARREIKPSMARFDCKMVEVLPTSTQPMRGFVDKMMRLESHSRLSTMSLIDAAVCQTRHARARALSLSPSLSLSLPVPRARSLISRVICTLFSAPSTPSPRPAAQSYSGGSDPRLLSISCIHGFMPADVPSMGSAMIVITDASAAAGEDAAAAADAAAAKGAALSKVSVFYAPLHFVRILLTISHLRTPPNNVISTVT